MDQPPRVDCLAAMVFYQNDKVQYRAKLIEGQGGKFMGFSQYFKGRNGGWFPGSKHFFMSPDIFHELASKLPTIESRLAQCISFLCFCNI